MFEPKQLAWAFITWGIVIIAGNEVAQSRERGYYPYCSPIAHEVQEAWHRGELREDDARAIIERCLHHPPAPLVADHEEGAAAGEYLDDLLITN